MLLIRDYRPDDLDAVLDIFFRAVHEGARSAYTPAQLAAWAPTTPDRPRWAERLSTGGVFVCESGGAPAGFARVDADGVIDLLFVHPAFQRQGVASALLERMLAWSSAATLRADVSRAARPFFEQRGFRVVAEREACRGAEALRYFEMRLERG